MLSVKIAIKMVNSRGWIQRVWLVMPSRPRIWVNLARTVLPATLRMPGLPPHSMGNIHSPWIMVRVGLSLALPAIPQVLRAIPAMDVMNIMNRKFARNMWKKAFRILRIAWSVTRTAASTMINFIKSPAKFCRAFYFFFDESGASSRGSNIPQRLALI